MTDELVWPNDLAAEAAVLSLIIVMPDMVRRVSPILRANDFYSISHQEIYAACIALHARGTQPDVVTVASYLRDNGKLDRAGGINYLTEILNSSPGTANCLSYARIVSGRSNVRKLITACQDIVVKGYAAHGDDADYLLKSGKLIREITRIADRSAISSNKEVLRDVFLEIQAAAARGSDVSGLRTGLDDFDRLTTGLHGGQMTLFAARPAGGKSAILLQTANNVARQKIGVVFFSLEMVKSEMVIRQISMHAKVDSSNLSIGRLTKEDWSRVTTAAGEIANYPIRIDDTPDLTIYQIRERALGAIDEGAVDGTPIGLICIDYAQRVRVAQDDKKAARHEQVATIIRGIKELCKETSLPSCVAVQLKRIPEGRPGRRPGMDDLRESGDLEAEADVIACLHRSSQYDKTADNRSAELIVVENRHGSDGLIDLSWSPEFTLFGNKNN